MPNIATRRVHEQKRQPGIGELRERVVICTTVEKPDGNVSTIVNRPGVIRVHAKVRPIRGERVLDYQAVFGGRENAPTHEITIRVPPDVKVDLNHWVFQETGYAKTWFKVRSVEDMAGVGRFLLLLCTIDTLKDGRNDPVTQEPPPRWREPHDGKPPIPDRI
jgi:hypothetical protein